MSQAPKRELSLLDCVCLIVGIIVGTGIFILPADVAKGLGQWWAVVAIWIVGGVLSLFGALGYAELGAAYPREGGDYVYLTRAYGRWAGFLFGWVQLVIVRPGDIAGMALAFALAASAIANPFPAGWSGLTVRIYAGAAIIICTAINILGVRGSKWTQNVLTGVKALGLLAVVVAAAVSPLVRAGAPATQTAPQIGMLPTSVALILVLFTFGGWNEMAYVAAEVRRPERNIIRALVLGTAAVTGLYVLVNAGYLLALGHGGLAALDTDKGQVAAAETVSTVLPGFGRTAISALICISALGAVHGLIFTGARITYAIGSDYRAFRILGQWYGRTGTPIPALLLQCAIALAVVLALGDFVKAVIYTSPVVYLFYLATSRAVIVLRYREPDVPRPYRVTWYPEATIIFCLVCAYLIYSGVTYKPLLTGVAIGIALLGLPVYWLVGRSRANGQQGARSE